MNIDTNLVQKLINLQFPQWKDLPITPVSKGGWDNRMFHLGEKMLVRLPSASSYVPGIEKEQKWLPYLRSCLELPIPSPIGIGKPENIFPYPWSVYNWIKGETASANPPSDLNNLARELAQFLQELQKIDSKSGPPAGKQNFFRGGDLRVYDEQARKAIEILKGSMDTAKAIHVWEKATASKSNLKVWVHGDVSPDNLLVKDNNLSAVIDFGTLGVGDPACDLAIGWTFFDTPSLKIFQKYFSFDEKMWDRAKGWALWKALIIQAKLTDPGNYEAKHSKRTLSRILQD